MARKTGETIYRVHVKTAADEVRQPVILGVLGEVVLGRWEPDAFSRSQCPDKVSPKLVIVEQAMDIRTHDPAIGA